jgi:peptidoglycan-N-acetylglucosamine deacetylase
LLETAKRISHLHSPDEGKASRHTGLTIVTTSWDDGYPIDLKLAELLQRYNLLGTFYYPLNGEDGRAILSLEDLRSLHSAGFEIGAHSVTHAILTAIPRSQARSEIFDCKRTLQDLLGSEVRMFCYPRGYANAYTIRCVEEAGYRGARGTQLLSIEKTFSRFVMPTSLQAVPHRSINYVRNLARRRAWSSLSRYCRELRAHPNWVALGKRLFDEALRCDGLWHLWGHSWEIEELGLWADLEELFAYVGGRAGVLYGSNGWVIDALEKLQVRQGDGDAV